MVTRAATVYARWREVWIHLVDLDLGVRPDDWPAELAAHAIGFLGTRLPAGTRLVAPDAGHEWPGDGEARTVVEVGVRDLAAWLAGRLPSTRPGSSGGLPPLGHWPHPPR